MLEYYVAINKNHTHWHWCGGEKPNKDTQLDIEDEFNCAKNKNSLRLEDNILKCHCGLFLFGKLRYGWWRDEVQ